MKKLLLATVLAATGIASAPAQNPSPHTFTVSNGSFCYDGKPVGIYSGEVHYARVPQAYWRHRLQLLRAMGLNTVTTYVFWNYHETAPGVWDFRTESRNLREFVLTAQREGLMVILRPGPYTCAEWEFGGYPWWLQRNPALEIRTNNRPFLDSCRTYLGKLAEQVADLEVSKGGPIIMVQVENEFGSYVVQRKDIPLDQHRAYNAAIKQMLEDAGFGGPFFTSDGSWLFAEGTIPGALPTANGERDIAKLRKVVNEYNGGQGPYMVAEYYPGWLDHWGEPFQKVPTEKVANQVEKYLANGISFNFYMAHGGTNFGFTAGANYSKEHNIQPDLTSYDYDAPISEAGWATPKYRAIRQVMERFVPYAIPPIPDSIPVIELPPIMPQQSANVLASKSTLRATAANTPLSFEELGQGHGYAIYSRHFNDSVSGTLAIPGLRDYATVHINGQKVGYLSRQSNRYTIEVHIPAGATLDLLVENMGRINYDAEIVHNSKGIISPVTLNGTPLTGSWTMYGLPMDTMPSVRGNGACTGSPALYAATFKVDKPGDTFLDMRSWGKGIVFVNGHNLGRYWNIGPQQTLYLPSAWLRRGKNRIVVFEQQNDAGLQPIRTARTPILEQLNLPK